MSIPVFVSGSVSLFDSVSVSVSVSASVSLPCLSVSASVLLPCLSVSVSVSLPVSVFKDIYIIHCLFECLFQRQLHFFRLNVSFSLLAKVL